MKRTAGFTVLELIIVIVVLGVIGLIGLLQYNNLAAMQRDEQRKTAINAMYYGLEEAFYPANEYYPRTLSSDNLKTVDPELFSDPNGNAIGESNSDYRYEPINCNNNECQGYTLRTTLENEADFIKTNRDN